MVVLGRQKICQALRKNVKWIFLFNTLSDSPKYDLTLPLTALDLIIFFPNRILSYHFLFWESVSRINDNNESNDNNEGFSSEAYLTTPGGSSHW